MIYLLKIEPDNGTLLVTCPAFPEVTTFAETEADVPDYALGAMEEAITGRMHYGEPIPAPATQAQVRLHGGPCVALPLWTAFKIRLYTALHS